MLSDAVPVSAKFTGQFVGVFLLLPGFKISHFYFCLSFFVSNGVNRNVQYFYAVMKHTLGARIACVSCLYWKENVIKREMESGLCGHVWVVVSGDSTRLSSLISRPYYPAKANVQSSIKKPNVILNSVLAGTDSRCHRKAWVLLPELEAWVEKYNVRRRWDYIPFAFWKPVREVTFFFQSSFGPGTAEPIAY